MTLEEFITERIADDDTAAMGASIEYGYETWTADANSVDTITESNVAHPVELTYNDAVAVHVARQDPQRVHRHCEFARGLLDAYRTAVAARDSRNQHATNAFTAGQDAAAIMWLGWALQKTAAIWSDHPDYRQEWSG
ncbi:hypothetical protein NONO_c59600 [Nocardia nova SH22a]|uniref:Uncharacterized protein n=1 Tax=Nocardia nova SH22a TaxID=1415166 RepID=W5TU56_9NOCA|nr:DUF6221 family protein [Nocardia nova]AHH20736.1 hypothetical protein NONO_c59600 [Nocardia nova SH22a]